MNAIICDKCKTVMTSQSELKVLKKLSCRTEELGEFGEIHLCKFCYQNFKKWLHGELELIEPETTVDAVEGQLR